MVEKTEKLYMELSALENRGELPSSDQNGASCTGF